MRTPKSDREKSKKAILVYLRALPKKQIYYGSVLAEYVRDRIGKKDPFPDTALKYMRELRQDGFIKYQCLSKRESKYVKL